MGGMVDGDERWEKSEKREYKGMEYSRRRGTEVGEEEVETKIKGSGKSSNETTSATDSRSRPWQRDEQHG